MNRFFWVARGQLFRLVYGVKFIYLGKPMRLSGLRRLKASESIGMYPSARIEIGKKGKILIGTNFRSGHCLFMQTNSQITIGNNVTISANVFIGTTDYHWREKTDLRLKDRVEIEKPIIIGNCVFIGVGAAVLPGATLSNGCVVGANVVVRGFYPEYSIIK